MSPNNYSSSSLLASVLKTRRMSQFFKSETLERPSQDILRKVGVPAAKMLERLSKFRLSGSHRSDDTGVRMKDPSRIPRAPKQGRSSRLILSKEDANFNMEDSCAYPMPKPVLYHFV